MKKYQIRDCYDFSEVIAQAPYFTDTWSVHVFSYGFLHNVGIVIEFVNDRLGEGWKDFRKNFNVTVNHCKECWQNAIDFAYH